ncbi:hypothetical protein Tco_0760164, partial [Tanacetum coccineum]
YVVPTGRVVVLTGRYVVPAGKVIIIVSPGRLNLVPTGRILSPEGIKGKNYHTCFTLFLMISADFHYKGAQGYMECSSKQAKPRDEDINLTLLRALPSSWSQDTPTFSSSQSAVQADSALLSTTSASKKMSYLDSPCYSSSTYTTPSNSKTGSHRSGNIIEDVLQSFVADTEPEQQLAYEDFDR